MPFEQGPCPFDGSHWPETWPLGKVVSAKKFGALHELQKRDLIQYFFKRESKVTQQHPQPKYEFPLNRLRGYFRRADNDIRRAVLDSDEYKAYAKERIQPSAPPGPSLGALDRPSHVDEASAADVGAAILSSPAAAPFGAAAGAKRAAPDPDPEGAGTPGALSAKRAAPEAIARARNCDVACEALSGASPVPPPQSQGEPLRPVFALTARGN